MKTAAVSARIMPPKTSCRCDIALNMLRQEHSRHMSLRQKRFEPRSSMADVFISYQRAEHDAVQIIANKLVELKVDIWFDAKLQPGGSFDEEIAQAIKDAKAVLT